MVCGATAAVVVWFWFIYLLIMCLLFQMWPIHSEISNCVIKREEERCMERIAQHDPGEDAAFGKKESDENLNIQLIKSFCA